MSSLRLRKALVLRSYNLRNDDQTMEEQFAHLCDEEDGQIYISIDSIKNYLNFDEGSSEGSYNRLLSGTGLTGKRVAYSDFIEFLETGRAGEQLSPSRKASKIRILKGFPGISSNKDLNVPGKAAIKSQPPSSVEDRASPENVGSLREKHEAALRLAQTLATADYTDSETTGSDPTNKEDGGANKQSEGTPEPKGTSPSAAAEIDEHDEYDGPEPIVEEKDDDEDVNVDGTNLVESYDVVLHPNANNPMFRSSIASSVWRKREVVKHERQVYYTTVDAEGQLQELVEKETSQTEVLHMESRETGEFAHRETKVYSQQETFNDEVVTDRDGQEEYVHLKSQDDEYEHTTSDMPPKDDGEQPGSPRVGGSTKPHAGDNGDPRNGFAAAAEAQGGVGHIDLSGVDPDHLDDETKAYFCWVLEQQQQEAHTRLAAMKQQQDLVEQTRAFDGLEDSDLDDETRAYRDYLAESLKNIGEYLSCDPGEGVLKQMLHIQDMEAMQPAREGAEERRAADEENELDKDHVFARVQSPARPQQVPTPTRASEGEDVRPIDDEVDSDDTEEDMTRIAQEALAAAIAAAGAEAEAAKLAGREDYEELLPEDATTGARASALSDAEIQVKLEEENASMHDID